MSLEANARYRARLQASPRVTNGMLDSVGVSVDECWIWAGRRDEKGYGRDVAGLTAHRYLYRAVVEEVPDDMQIDHLCRNTSCVNPDHLEPVTAAENIRRRYELVTHCKRDHEFTEENTRRNAKGERVCRSCVRENQANYKARKRAAS